MTSHIKSKINPFHRHLRAGGLFLLLVIMLFCAVPVSYAQNVTESAEINVTLDQNGDAQFRTIWNATHDSNTEIYIPIENLEKYKFENFQVFENGVPYTFVENWNIDASQQEKINRYGIVKTEKGIEICWGIGEYGMHSYELRYTIRGMVKNYTESQGLFWQFINPGMNEAPQSVDLIIKGPIQFTSENTKIWGFGLQGQILMDNGSIHLQTNQALNSSNYVTVLAQFSPGLFATQEQTGTTFQSVKDVAFVGSDYQSQQAENGGLVPGKSDPFQSIFASISGFIFPAIIVLVSLLSFILRKGKRSGRIKKRNDLQQQYYRDVPYKGHIEELYYMLSEENFSSMESMMTAYFLKWIKDGVSAAQTVQQGLIFKKDETAFALASAEKLLSLKEKMGDYESKFFNIVMEAAGENRILESKELSKHARRNYKSFEDWEQEMLAHSEQLLTNRGYYSFKKRKVLFFTQDVKVITQSGTELRDNIQKFNNFLSDYSLLAERESVNVHLWDEWMIYAGMLGITEKVKEEFKKIYPQYEAETVYHGNTFFMVAYMASQTSNSYASASSGGGGSTSIGGGGGSFGGGGFGGGSR